MLNKYGSWSKVPKSELEKLSTQRLLNVYREVRHWRFGYRICWCGCGELENKEGYDKSIALAESIKEILNTKAHVINRKRKKYLHS